MRKHKLHVKSIAGIWDDDILTIYMENTKKGQTKCFICNKIFKSKNFTRHNKCKKHIKNLEIKNEYEPYFGWCEVDGCTNEGCSGGIAWGETGYWTVCSKHSAAYRDGKKKPKMKKEAIAREAIRDKETGYILI